MLLGKRFDEFVKQSPVSVMVNGILERIFQGSRLEQLFEEHTVRQYTRDLTFGQCVDCMCDVVTRIVPSVGSWFQLHHEELGVSRQALYDKLRHLELPTSTALVRYSAAECLAVLKEMKPTPAPLPGYRLRVIDGNHLASTERRLKELRRLRSGPLPGLGLAFYDVQFGVIDDVVLCEDGHAQERSLFPAALERIVAGDCLVADRNFCTLAFLCGIHTQSAKFVIREHANFPLQLVGRSKGVGRDRRGRKLTEQEIQVTDPESGQTHTWRRVTIYLTELTQAGETELHILTNLPKRHRAARVADLYADRWTIERAFWHLSEDLSSEIDTLAYPRAALFGFSVAVVAYNVVQMAKGAIAATWGEERMQNEISMYYLAQEVSRVTPGMLIAVPPPAWKVFATMSSSDFAKTLLSLAASMNLSKYRKSKRGPKKKQPKKLSGKHKPHVSTARLLAGRTA